MNEKMKCLKNPLILTSIPVHVIIYFTTKDLAVFFFIFVCVKFYVNV